MELRKLAFSLGSIAVFCFAPQTRAQQTAPQDVIPLRIELLSRAISKTPLIIAQDQGLYKKYGLDVKIWLPEAEYPNAKPAEIDQPKVPDLSVDGGTPMMVNMTRDARYPRRKIVGETDCNVRWQIIGQKGLTSIDQLKGKRLGISGPGAMTNFVALLFAQRMGWDPVKDISIMSNAWKTDALKDGIVDAFVADERYYANAIKEGYPVLAETAKWNAQIAGNSIRAEWNWLKVPRNQEAVRRFLKATLEGMALYHKNRDLAVQVLMKWHGLDRETASLLYTQGESMPRKMYPCYDGIKKTMELFDSNEMRKYKAEDFYDDSYIKALDQSGFIDALYK